MTESLKVDIPDLFAARLYKKSDRIQQNIVLKIREKTVGTLQNFVIFSGLPKASKSTFLAATVAACFTPWEVYSIKMDLPELRKKVLFVDTESSSFDFQRQMEKIRKHTNQLELPRNLAAISVREDEPGTIFSLIEWYLATNPDCSVVFLDGILDICWNYNDERESRVVINWLKKITKRYDCLLIGVIHLSKGTGTTLGHLGSLADRYAQSTIEICKIIETKQFVMKPKFLRSSDDFDPVAIMWLNDDFYQVEYQEIPNFQKTKSKKNDA